jgi:hypothetical protein
MNTDSGSEFLNTPVYNMFSSSKVNFTRSRAYKKMITVTLNKKISLTQENYLVMNVLKI